MGCITKDGDEITLFWLLSGARKALLSQRWLFVWSSDYSAAELAPEYRLDGIYDFG
jgi:hypothetical protein